MSAPSGPLVLFIAASLAGPFQEISNAFLAAHPEVQVAQEASASRVAARKVAELRREADIVAAADAETIPDILMPAYADWSLLFLRERLALIYSPRSRYAADVSTANWHEVLLRPWVEFGVSNPDVPVGYRALLSWKLAERYYRRPGLYDALSGRLRAKNVRPDASALLALLDAGEIDYIFDYESLARQRGLRFVALPREINLGDPSLEKSYAQVEVAISSGASAAPPKIVRGRPIVYAITVLKNAPHRAAAIEFLRFMLGPEGRVVFKRRGMTPIAPPKVLGPGRPPRELEP